MNERTFLELLAYLCSSYVDRAQSDPEQDQKIVSYLKERGVLQNVPRNVPPTMASNVEKEVLDVPETAQLLGYSAK